jgi:hypothetical protein
MDTESQKLFDRLVRLSPQDLWEADVAFLKARQEYLSESERVSFAAILDEPKPEPKPKKKAE